MLLALLSFIFFPVLSSWCHRHGITLFQCTYERMTGEPCPFCGTTTQIWRLIHGKVCISIPVLVLLVAYFTELLKHASLLLSLWRRKTWCLSAKARLWDIVSTFSIVVITAIVFFTAWFMGESGFGAIRLTL